MIGVWNRIKTKLRRFLRRRLSPPSVGPSGDFVLKVRKRTRDVTIKLCRTKEGEREERKERRERKRKQQH